jgi:DNA-directed RNA polymerase subunit H (RpoH/RPB5)
MDLTEAVYRSRLTIFKALEARGFDTAKYNKLGIDEIKVFTTNNYPEYYNGLDMSIPHREDSAKQIRVFYTDAGKVTQYQRILNMIEKLEGIDSKTDELVYMIQDPINDKVHSLVASQLWFKKGIRVSFFCVYEIVVNPLEHVLVPRHEVVPKDEIPALLKTLRVTERSQLPLIRYHTDPIVRLIGGVPGDIIKITRSSPSAGEYIVYRACVP